MGKCECGCGSEVETGRRFRQGHNAKRGVLMHGKMPDPNPSGLCFCGCGKTTTIATSTLVSGGRIKGKHVRFRIGHQARLLRGENASRWKGGKTVNHEGYIRVRTTNPDGTRGYEFEHRVVMSESLGRPLRKTEQVHHLNGDKSDNRLENLELWDRSQPNGVRITGLHCKGCICAH